MHDALRWHLAPHCAEGLSSSLPRPLLFPSATVSPPVARFPPFIVHSCGLQCRHFIEHGNGCSDDGASRAAVAVVPRHQAPFVAVTRVAAG